MRGGSARWTNTVRRVVVERRRVRAQPAGLAQVDALLRRQVPGPRRVGLRAEAHLVRDLEAVADAEQAVVVLVRLIVKLAVGALPARPRDEVARVERRAVQIRSEAAALAARFRPDAESSPLARRRQSRSDAARARGGASKLGFWVAGTLATVAPRSRLMHVARFWPVMPAHCGSRLTRSPCWHSRGLALIVCRALDAS